MTDTATGLDLQHMSIHGIARVIRQDWSNVNPAAAPYLDAMAAMQSIDDRYGWDDGHMIVRYFLGNAQSWRGAVAREVKAELNRRLK